MLGSGWAGAAREEGAATLPAIPPLFSPRQVYEILAQTVYGKRKHAEVGIERLLNEGVYSAAFPLHEVRGWDGTGEACLVLGFGCAKKPRTIISQGCSCWE